MKDPMSPDEECPAACGWSPIHIEGYCLLNVDYEMRKDRDVFEMQADGSFIRVDNPMYDPDIRPDPRPEGCRGSVCSQCIRCVYFGWCDVEEDEKRSF